MAENNSSAQSLEPADWMLIHVHFRSLFDYYRSEGSRINILNEKLSREGKFLFYWRLISFLFFFFWRLILRDLTVSGNSGVFGL